MPGPGSHDRARARRRRAGGGHDDHRAPVVAGQPPVPVLHEGRRPRRTSPTSRWRASRASTRTRRGVIKLYDHPFNQAAPHLRGLRRAVPRAVDARRDCRPSSRWSSSRRPDRPCRAGRHLRRLQPAVRARAGERGWSPPCCRPWAPRRSPTASPPRAGDEARLAAEAIARGFRRIVAVGGDGTWSNVGNAIIRSGVGRRPRPGARGDRVRPRQVRSASPRSDLAGCARDRARRPLAAHRRRAHRGPLLPERRRASASTSRSSRTRGRCGTSGATSSTCTARSASCTASRASRSRWRLDGEAPARREMLMLVIANARIFGGGFKIAPEADLADGRLDVVSFANMPLLAPAVDHGPAAARHPRRGAGGAHRRARRASSCASTRRPPTRRTGSGIARRRPS